MKTKKIISMIIIGVLIIPQLLVAQSLDSTLYNEEGFLLTTTDSDIQTQNVSDLTEEELVEFEALLRQPQQDIAENVKRGEVISCFDYYSFGSIQINLTQNFNTYEPGEPILIRGTLTNTNPYPVTNLTLRARLVKNIPNSDYLRSEIIVIEDVDIIKNITIPANEGYEVSYSHLLPFNAPSGEYQMYFYAIEQDRYNLAGLSFTNDIVGSKISFEVAGNNPEHIYLDQTQIEVAGYAHNVMGFMTQHQPGVPVDVSIPLTNPSSQTKEMTVTYSLYSWDANPQNFITSKTEQVIVAPQSETMLTYTLDAGTLPVYYLSIEAKPTNPLQNDSVIQETTKSNIRFVIRDTSLPRLNFSTVSTYPLAKGEESSIVTCFHNTNDMISSYSKIETTLKDSRGNILSQTLYEGFVPSDITAIREIFKPKQDLYNFTLTTIMYDENNNIIDEVNKVYSCEDIDQELCVAERESQQSFLIYVGLILLALIAIFVFIIRKKILTIEKI